MPRTTPSLMFSVFCLRFYCCERAFLFSPSFFWKVRIFGEKCCRPDIILDGVTLILQIFLTLLLLLEPIVSMLIGGGKLRIAASSFCLI